MADELTPEEFATWLAPRQAVAFLNGLGSTSIIVEAVNDRAIAGHLRIAVAEISTPGQAPMHRRVLSKEMWKAVDPGYQHQFWQRADVEFTMNRHQRHQQAVRLTAVKFDPAGLEQIRQDAGLVEPLAAAEPPSPQPELARSVRKPLSDADLDAWAALFNRANPGASEGTARAAVEAMFPDKYVARDRLRRVLPERLPGRPRKSLDK